MVLPSFSTKRPERFEFSMTSSTDHDEDDKNGNGGGSENIPHSNMNEPEELGELCDNAEEGDEQEVTSTATSSRLSRVPRLFRYDNAPPEATALAMDVFARATILMSSIFLGPALLELASHVVEENCQLEALNNDFHNESSLSLSSQEQEQQDLLNAQCMENGRIYGFRPSSLLSNIAIVSGILGSVFMPLAGSIVDHTPYRWHVGAASAMGLAMVKGIETIVSSSTWFPVACLQVVSAILFNMHITTTLAYTSELTLDPIKQTSYNTYYIVVLYISTLFFLAWVTAMSFILNQDDVGTARISQVTTSTVSAFMFFYAWKYFFRHRPALSKVPTGETVWSVGFQKVGRTFVRIVRELPALKWLTIAVMFGESASATLVTIATTYMKTFLEMDANEIGVVFFMVLLMGGPGSKLGGWLALKLKSSIRSAILCNTLLSLNTIVAAMTLTGPEHKHHMPLIGAVWGLGLGWQHPMDSTAWITIIPKGQEAELMGLYILAGQLLSWLPPIVFTALNEAGVDMAYGLASVDLFFLVAIAAFIIVGTYEEDMDPVSLYDDLQEQQQQRQEDSEASSDYEEQVNAPKEEILEMTTPGKNSPGVQHRNSYTLPAIA